MYFRFSRLDFSLALGASSIASERGVPQAESLFSLEVQCKIRLVNLFTAVILILTAA